MPQTASPTTASRPAPATAATIGARRTRGTPLTTTADPQALLMRGVVHGVILSLMVWTAIGYLALILR